LGRVPEQGPEQDLLVIAPPRRPARPVVVGQGEGVSRAGVGLDPVVDTLPGHAEQPSDVGRRAALVEFQDSQRPAVESGVRGLRELTL
jgi:hypothetical protein